MHGPMQSVGDPVVTTAVHRAARRRPFTSVRAAMEFRWSLDTESHVGWDGDRSTAQIATFEAGDGTQRVVSLPQHVIYLALDATDCRMLAGLEGERPALRTLQPGTLTYLPPDAQACSLSWGRSRGVTVLLDPAAVTAEAEHFVPEGRKPFDPQLLTADDERLRELLRAMASVLANEPWPDRLRVQSIAAMIARRVAEGRSDGPQRHAGDGRARRMVRLLADYIDERVDTRLALDELARVCGRSPSQTCRIARSAFGVPLHRYVLSRRLMRARVLLATGDTPISEVAVQTGFSSQSHLTSCFAQQLGTTPASYRREIRTHAR